LKFGIVFILAFYIIKFSFWSFMFDSIFCLVFYISKFLFSRLKAEKKKKRKKKSTYSSVWNVKG